MPLIALRWIVSFRTRYLVYRAGVGAISHTEMVSWLCYDGT